jgi:hypothetical protein
MGKKHAKARQAEPARAERPYCFISYSSREPHVAVLVECCQTVFSKHYRVEITPSALMSGSSQLQQITKLIEGCAFGIVALDGLRANVAFEYGMLHAHEKPVILLKEESAQVDIESLFRDSANLTLKSVALDMDSHFSDVKDMNYASWNRHSFVNTAKLLRAEFAKRRSEIKPYIEIPEFTW